MSETMDRRTRFAFDSAIATSRLMVGSAAALLAGVVTIFRTAGEIFGAWGPYIIYASTALLLVSCVLGGVVVTKLTAVVARPEDKALVPGDIYGHGIRGFSIAQTVTWILGFLLFIGVTFIGS